MAVEVTNQTKEEERSERYSKTARELTCSFRIVGRARLFLYLLALFPFIFSLLNFFSAGVQLAKGEYAGSMLGHLLIGLGLAGVIMSLRAEANPQFEARRFGRTDQLLKFSGALVSLGTVLLYIH